MHDDAILVHKIANRVYLIVAVGVGHLGDPRDLQPLPAPCKEALPVGALVDDEARLHIRVSEREVQHTHVAARRTRRRSRAANAIAANAAALPVALARVGREQQKG